MQIGGEWVATDRLGSVVRKGTTNYKYAPYGQEIGGATPNDTNKFATYTRDSLSGLDYALNRYYKPEWGRFTSPDPYQASGGPADPGSWNRYTYVGGDPVNYADPEGLQMVETQYSLGGQLVCQYTIGEGGRRERIGCAMTGLAFQRFEEAGGRDWGNVRDLMDSWVNSFDRQNSRLRSTARQTINTLDPKCISDLKSAFGPGAVDSLKSSTDTATFWKATDPISGKWTIGDIVGPLGRNASTPLASAGAEGRHAVVIQTHQANGIYIFNNTNHVVLFSQFYSLNATMQAFTLVHELLHVAFDKGDVQLANALGIDYSASGNPSWSITEFLKHGCDKSRSY
jgi:RHS repeat-associated protein